MLLVQMLDQIQHNLFSQNEKNNILLCTSSSVNNIQIKLNENEHICNMVGDGVLSAAFTQYIE